MKNYRVYVEKYPRFQLEADTLRKELNSNLGLKLTDLRLLNVYDLFGFSEELLEKVVENYGGVVKDDVTIIVQKLVKS